MTAISINAKNRTIELTKTFATASSKFGTPEYDQLQLARSHYPNFKVVTITRKASKNSKPTFKGLTYEYMEKYIMAHDDEEQTIMNEYLALCGESETEENLKASFNYQEMKDWFLDKFPAFNEYHTKRDYLRYKSRKSELITEYMNLGLTKSRAYGDAFKQLWREFGCCYYSCARLTLNAVQEDINETAELATPIYLPE